MTSNAGTLEFLDGLIITVCTSICRPRLISTNGSKVKIVFKHVSWLASVNNLDDLLEISIMARPRAKFISSGQGPPEH